MVKNRLNIEVILVLFIAFVCEIIDSLLGMLYEKITLPVLIIAGFDSPVVVSSVLFSQAIVKM